MSPRNEMELIKEPSVVSGFFFYLHAACISFHADSGKHLCAAGSFLDAYLVSHVYVRVTVFIMAA